MQPLRPGMMMNTLYSFNDNAKKKRQGMQVRTPVEDNNDHFQQRPEFL